MLAISALSTTALAGDNSVVPLAIGIAVAMVVIMAVVLFLTKDKK